LADELPEIPESFIQALEARVSGFKDDDSPDDAASSAAGAGDDDADVDAPDEAADAAEPDTDDEPDSESDDDEAAAEPDDAPEAEGDDAQARDFYTQVPEEKRQKAFNDTKAHSNRLAKELADIKAENERLKAGGKPAESTPEKETATEPELQEDVTEWIKAAIVTEDETKLTQGQKQARAASFELENLLKTRVKPADEAVKATSSALEKAKADLADHDRILSWLEGRAKENSEGYYDDEIATAKAKRDRLDRALDKAELAAIKASSDYKATVADYNLRWGQSRENAARAHSREVSTHRTEREQKTGQAKIDREWSEALAAARKESGLDDELWALAEKAAYRYVEEKASAGLIPEGSFKKLILEGIGPLVKRHGTKTATEIEERRARVTAEPGAGRVASRRNASRGEESIVDLKKNFARELQGAFSRGHRF